MKHININFKLAFLALVSMALVACGGGGSSSTSSTSTPGTVSGTAATGAPITNAAVTVFDAKGNTVCSTTTDASTGAYSCPTFDTAANPAPYVVKVVGTIGDALDTLYAVAPTAGTANVSHISNAMAATLAKGDPSSLESGNSLTASQINTVDSGFQAAFATAASAVNFSGSVVTGPFNSTMDAFLDNIHAATHTDGATELASSEGLAEPELTSDSGVTTASGVSLVALDAGKAPSSSDASNVPAPSTGLSANIQLAGGAAVSLAASTKPAASAETLETLRAKLQKCFSHPAAERATLATSLSSNAPNWTSIHADCSGLDSGSFKHESFYWIDGKSANSLTNPSRCNTSGSTYCLGEFGAMLLSSTYDNLIFQKPRSIRRAGAKGDNLWHVQFPVTYNDGTLGQFGDIIGSYSFMVVKYDAASGGFLMHGDQRDIQSYILPTAQLVQKGTENKYRVETNFNTYVRSYSIRSLLKGTSAVYPISAVITPLTNNGMLPAGGITLANKLNVAKLTNNTVLAKGSGVTSAPASGTGATVFFNACDGYLNLENKSLAPTIGSANQFNYNVSTANVSPCSGQLRMAYGEYTMDASGTLQAAAAGTYPPSPYPSNIISASQIINYNANGSLTANASSWATKFTAKKGEPYLFTVYLSDNTTLSYVNRLPHSLLSLDQAAKVKYPLATDATKTAFASFKGTGTASSFDVSWSAIKKGYVFASSLMWDRAEGSKNAGVVPGKTSNSISCAAYNSNMSILAFAPNATNYSDPLSCSDPNNWVSGANGTNVDSGILQLKARTPGALFISSQVRQY